MSGGDIQLVMVQFFEVTLDGDGNPKPKSSAPNVLAQFNPTQLQYTIQNTAARGGGQQRQQRVDDSSAKLTFDLIFDSTHDQHNVREDTQRLALLMKPSGPQGISPTVLMRWGTVNFVGAFESYKETIDFFSPQGTPLRASVNLTMSTTSFKNKAPNRVFKFASLPEPDPNEPKDPGAPKSAVEVPQDSRSPTQMARDGGSPESARALAAQSGAEDLRSPSGSQDPLVLDEDEPVELGAPVAFASAGLSAGGGISAGASAGLSAGAGFSAGADFSAGASAGFSAGASAGFSAGASAGFTGGAGFSAGADFAAGASANFAAGAGGGFGAGAGLAAGASFGAEANFSASTSFGAGVRGGGSASAGGSAFAGVQGGAFAANGFSGGVRVGAALDGSLIAGPSTSSLRSAGVPAAAGAFALLRAPSSVPLRRFDVNRLVVREETQTIATSSAQFAVGGRIVSASSTSFRTDASVTSRSRISFDEGG